MSGILVAVDHSEGARAALSWALDQASRWDQPLTVLSVCPTLGVPAGPGVFAKPSVSELDEMRAHTEAVVEAAQSGRASRVPVTVEVDWGSPVDAILARGEAVGQIVVGARGVGGFERMLMGSVSSAVVHHATCPVTVVPVNRKA